MTNNSSSWLNGDNVSYMPYVNNNVVNYVSKITIHSTNGVNDSNYYYDYKNNLEDAFAIFNDTIAEYLNTTIQYNNIRKRSATQEEAERIAYEATEMAQDFILREYNKYDIYEHGEWLYQRVSEEIAEWINDYIHDEYDFEEDGWEVMYDALMDVILKKIDYDAVYSTFDEILHAPTTMAEKLKDIGMSESDFL